MAKHTGPAGHDNSNDTLTHNAEQAVLGAMLLSATATAQAAAILTENHFADPHHQLLYRTILASPEWGDTLVVAARLATTDINKLPGGLAYLHTCVRACPSPSNIHHYAEIIANAATTRQRHYILARLQHALTADNPTTWNDTWTWAQTHQQLPPAAANGHNPIRLTPASTFRIRPVWWLWDGRIPIGEITLIPGREGVGKSILMAWLAAAITNGNLPGQHHGKPRAVLYAATEDSWEHGIAPRLLAAGARLDHVYRIDATDPDGAHRNLILPRDIHHLPDRAREVDAALLICDPIISLVDETINTFRAQELRKALEPLKTAVEAARLATACLVHFNKSTADVMTMISGSRAWGEVARAAIAIARDPDADDVTNVMSQVKNTLGRTDLPNLTYTIDDVTVETDFGAPAHPGRLRWTGETDTTVGELLAGTAERTLSDSALAILTFVADMGVPVTVQDVADHFKDSMRYEAVKKALARAAKRGDLEQPARGTYTAPTKRRRKRI